MSIYEVRWKPSADRSVCRARELHPEASEWLYKAVESVEYQLARNPSKIGKSIDRPRGLLQYIHVDDRFQYHSFVYRIEAGEMVVTVLKYHFVSHLELFDAADD